MAKRPFSNLPLNGGAYPRKAKAPLRFVEQTAQANGVQGFQPLQGNKHNKLAASRPSSESSPKSGTKLGTGPTRRSKRDWQRYMETRPVAPSFLPPNPADIGTQGRQQLPNTSSFNHSPNNALQPNGHKRPTRRSPAAMQAGIHERPATNKVANKIANKMISRAENKVPHNMRNPPAGLVSQPTMPRPPIATDIADDKDLELQIPSVQELEQEQAAMQQRRERGEEALRSLEEEARSQELERVRNSRIEIPDLELTPRKGNSYLHVLRLHKRYGRKVAVENISIALRQGEVVGLLGPNGAGKTTSFYMIAGFVHPTRGEVLLDEQDISRWPMYKRARQGISYLPQESSIFRSLTVEQNLLAILEYRGDLNRRARLKMANLLMERLGVLRLRKQRASTLSGGERRRVEVARALTLEPRFLLLDEPFAGIDPIAVSEIKGIICALAQSNIGILITDHNVRDTLDITDRSYIINLGEILVSGSREELITSKTAREVYLGAEFS